MGSTISMELQHRAGQDHTQPTLNAVFILVRQTEKLFTYSSKIQKEVATGCLLMRSPCLFSKVTPGVHVSVLTVTSGSCAVGNREAVELIY